MTETRATYFCIDIECNGPVPGLYDMVSLGAVAIVPDGEGKLALGPELYLELRPVAPRFNADAAAIHGLDQARLAAEGLSRAEFCSQLDAWVRATSREDTEAVFVGHNAPFDWSFVSYTFHEQGMANPFGYKALCTKSLSTGTLNLHWLDSNKDVLAQRLGLPDEDRSQKHRADYDARYQAELLLALLEHSGD